jgi:hypothetical protein
MPQKYLRKYDTAVTLDFGLFQPDGKDLETGATFAAGDLKIMKDEGAETNTTNLPTDEGTGYSLVLTATEMQAARIVVYIVDQTATKVWLDDYLVIESYGHASAQHAFDLDTAVQSVDATLIDGTAQRATDLAEIAQYLFANAATLTSVLDDDSVIGKLLAKAAVTNYDRTTDSQEALGENSTSAAAIADAVWDEDLSGHTTGGTAGEILGDVADKIWDEIMEAGAPAGSQTARQWMRLFAAALLAKTAGTGDWSAKSIDDTKTRISATLDTDGNRTTISTLDGS